MYPKYKIQQLIDNEAKKAIHILKLEQDIYWHIINPKTEEFKKLNPKYEGEYAWTSYNKKSAYIYLVHPKMASKNSTLGVILHELIHIVLDLPNINKFHEEKEERIVQALERLLLAKLVK